MKNDLVLLGDINLKGVERPERLFHIVRHLIDPDAVVFANLECCFYQPTVEDKEQRGFYVSPDVAPCLQDIGLDAVGTANNVTIGSDAITSSLATLDQLGIGHTGSGLDLERATAPVIVKRRGVRFGFMQRTAVHWPDGHAAADGRAGVATIAARTAYETGSDATARTRPGVPPRVMTWADPPSLASYVEDVQRLRKECDILVASFHWGYRGEVLQYQRDYAYAAVEAGADVVLGHGPHVILPTEFYRGKPIFYGLGNFSFQQEHGDVVHTQWTGMFADLRICDGTIEHVRLRFVERSSTNTTLVRGLADVPASIAVLEAAISQGRLTLVDRTKDLIIIASSD